MYNATICQGSENQVIKFLRLPLILKTTNAKLFNFQLLFCIRIEFLKY